MNQLQPAQIVQFARRFRFADGRVLRIRMRQPMTSRAAGEIVLRVLSADRGEKQRLRIVIHHVEEFRFQRRPGQSKSRLKDVKIGYFNGLFYLNLDPYADDSPPALHDFRASDAFIAGREFAWEIVTPRPKT